MTMIDNYVIFLTDDRRAIFLSVNLAQSRFRKLNRSLSSNRNAPFYLRKNMPKKGQLTKGKWIKCLYCRKDFWAQRNRIRKYNVKLCSLVCRKEWRFGLGEKREQIIALYRGGKSIIGISNIIKRGNSREGIRKLLTDSNIEIRHRDYYSQGERNSNWKRGFNITKDGYKRLNSAKNLMEHRMVMENFLKRKIYRNEHVHHLNGNKLDNRIENLVLLTANIHGGISAKQYHDWKKMYQDRIAELESLINNK